MRRTAEHAMPTHARPEALIGMEELEFQLAALGGGRWSR
jgi:hypothetical protein